ncbi:MAG: hypothetical protein ABS46_01405 [Cytophagaceae bacterium SCN 52-12]|nr:MAG: hypothetical protein ABS46_01405 [Cytophagaceae bacterium SCN 52-12]
MSSSSCKILMQNKYLSELKKIPASGILSPFFMPKFVFMGPQQNRLTFYAFFICRLAVLIPILLSCKKEGREVYARPGGPVVYNSENSGKQVNEALRYSRDFQQAVPDQVMDKIGSSFRIPVNNGPLALGSSLDNKIAWLYLEVVNTEDIPRKITLTTTHVRCDRLELFGINGKKIVRLGDVSRSTPLSSRPYLTQDFAFPIHMLPSDTTRILMRSTRLLGAMEVDFSIFDESDFLDAQYFGRNGDIFNLAFVLVIALSALIAGLGFGNRLMSAFGTFLLCTFLVYSYVLNFWDGFELPPFSGLQSYNLGCFFALLQGVFFHPFGNGILNSYGISFPIYRRITVLFMAANAIIAFGLLVSVPWADVAFGRSYTVLTLVNIACLVFVTGTVYRKRGEKWLLLIAIPIFAPTLIRLPMRLFHFSDQFYAAVVAPNIPLITALLAYFTVKQLLRQLTSKAELERRLTQIKMEMTDMRKEEVQKIGRNLHDQLGNTLASVLGYANMEIPDLKQVQSLLKRAIQEIRFMSHNLVKDDDQPLSEKIATVIDRFNDFSAIHFRFADYSGGKTDRLDEVQQQNIYLIIQELLTNAVRHSKAYEVVVQAFEYETSVQFTIEEDGIGFDPDRETDGLGIRNMYKRAELAGLRLTIESSVGNGTNVIIVAKYENESNHSG